VLRGIVKAPDLCSNEPTGVAQRLIDAGFTERYDYALESLQEVLYDRGGISTQKIRSVFTRCGCVM
jgi:NitT/TauT family transport system substrate-binding protein